MTPPLAVPDREELRRAAEGASRGPWSWDERGGVEAFVFGPDGDELVRVRMNLGLGSNPDRDAAYIAAANPQTVLWLLDQLAAREQELREIERQYHATGLTRGTGHRKGSHLNCGDHFCVLAAAPASREDV